MESKPFSQLGSFECMTLLNGLSKIGNQFYYLAAPLYLLKETNSPLIMSIFLAIQSTPYLLSSSIGSFIDKYNRRLIYVASEGIQFIIMLIVAYMVYKNLLEGHIFIFGTLVIILQLCAITSSLILDYLVLPNVARDENLTKWNSTYMFFINFCRLSGPLIAGFIMKYTEEYVVLIINSTTFLGTLTLGLILKEFKQINLNIPKKRMLKNSWLEFFKTKDLLLLTASLSLYNFGMGGVNLFIMTLLSEKYGASAFVIGLAVTAGGVGSLLGNLCISKITLKLEKSIKNIQFILGFCIFFSLVMAFPNIYVLITGFTLLSFCEGVIGVISTTYRQKTIPKELAGRFNGIIRVFLLGPVPLSVLFNGWIITKFNIAWIPVIFIMTFMIFSYITLSIRVLLYNKEASSEHINN